MMYVLVIAVRANLATHPELMTELTPPVLGAPGNNQKQVTWFWA